MRNLLLLLPIMSYATSRQFRVDGHFKSVFTKLPRPLAKDRKNTLANWRPI